MPRVVLLFPGQGSQKPGMGKDLAEAFPEARAVFQQADDALGESISTLCFEGPADTLTLTNNAQPALLTHSAAVLRVLQADLAGLRCAAAGHSLGELSAYHAVGCIDLPTAVRLVRRRGDLMLEAGRKRAGAMAAILGTLSTPIDELCRTASAATQAVVVPANYNSADQIVISGDPIAVERAMELAQAAGAKRAIKLAVSGAFHSPLMEPAVDAFRESVGACEFKEPQIPVYANVTAAAVRTAVDAKRLVVDQLTSPVRWTGLVQSLAADFPDAIYVELGTGSVLSGLVKRIAPSVQVMSCGTPKEVEQLQARLA